jgi:hypothetical protein
LLLLFAFFAKCAHQQLLLLFYFVVDRIVVVSYCIVLYCIDRFCINLSLVVSILQAHLLVSGGGFIHSLIHSLLLAEVELISNHVLMGKGEFGVVREVAALHVSDECPCSN